MAVLQNWRDFMNILSPCWLLCFVNCSEQHEDQKLSRCGCNIYCVTNDSPHLMVSPSLTRSVWGFVVNTGVSQCLISLSASFSWMSSWAPSQSYSDTSVTLLYGLPENGQNSVFCVLKNIEIILFWLECFSIMVVQQMSHSVSSKWWYLKI